MLSAACLASHCVPLYTPVIDTFPWGAIQAQVQANARAKKATEQALAAAALSRVGSTAGRAGSALFLGLALRLLHLQQARALNLDGAAQHADRLRLRHGPAAQWERQGKVWRLGLGMRHAAGAALLRGTTSKVQTRCKPLALMPPAPGAT